MLIDIDDCQLSPCQNGGLCNDEIDAYNCTCAHGWSGVNCTISNNLNFNV